MNRRTVLPALFAALCLLTLPVLAATVASVTLRYDHPEQFTETRKLRAMAPQLADDAYLKTLKAYVETRAAKQLAPGEQLAIVVTDLDRAGNFEPWRPLPLRNVRIIKDIYPPRVDLRFKLTDADGKLLREGTRTLRDPAFMSDSGYISNTDSLRYEKALFDRWLRKGPNQL